jgi:hypothetical protein
MPVRLPQCAPAAVVLIFGLRSRLDGDVDFPFARRLGFQIHLESQQNLSCSGVIAGMIKGGNSLLYIPDSVEVDLTGMSLNPLSTN